MLRVYNISDFDIRVDLYGVTLSGTGQSKATKNVSADYSDIWAKEVQSNLTNDTEASEHGQVVYKNKRSFAIRKADMTITNRMIVEYGSEDYHIISIHPYGSDREVIVLECMSRDND